MHRACHSPKPSTRPRKPRLWPLVMLGLIAYGCTAFYSVRPNEQAVVRRFGRPLPELARPGLHIGLPWGLDRVDRVKLSERKRVGVWMSVAERELGRTFEPMKVECLSGDRNLMLVPAVVQYHVDDPHAYLFAASDVPGVIRNIAAAALCRVVSSMRVDDVLTEQRRAIQDEVKRATQAGADGLGLGVRITAVSLERVAPPEEVKDAFDDVTAARSDSEKTILDAQGYRNEMVSRTRAEVEEILIGARGKAEAIEIAATGQAERFTAIATEAGVDAEHRELTERRLILETLEQVLPRVKKVLVDDEGGRVDVGIVERP